MGEKVSRTTAGVIIGLVLVLVLCGAEAATPGIYFVHAYVAPSYAPTDLKTVVEDLMRTARMRKDVRDSDFDEIYDTVETIIGTDPNNADSDFDSLTDLFEIQNGLDPLSPDSNSDGLPDYYEVIDVPSDFDGDGIPNAWDFDNDGDGVNDAVDLSPFAKTAVNNRFNFTLQTNGLPTYITFQVKPQNLSYLKLLNKYWDWPYPDDKGSMKDQDNSADDVHVVPILNLTANVIPEQSKVTEYGITTNSGCAYVPLYAVEEYGTTVALTGRMIYPKGAPLNLSLSVELIWKVIGKTDEKAISLKSSGTGNYVSVDNQGKVTIGGLSIGEGEKLQPVDLGRSKVAYKAPNGRYLSVADDGVVLANATDIGNHETFELVPHYSSWILLKAYNGLYLSTRNDGSIAAISQLRDYPEIFESKDAGLVTESITLVTYKEPFMLSGLAVEENYGTKLGLFFGHNRNETIAANLLLSYEFLRNSNTTLPDMPSILSNFGSEVFCQTASFPHKDEAFMFLANKAMPQLLDMLQAGASSQILPIIDSVEDQFSSLDLSEMALTNSTGALWAANLTAQPIITSKALKMNLYNTTTRKSLELDEVVSEVYEWDADNTELDQIVAMMVSWNVGEQFVTKVGQKATKFELFPDETLNEIFTFAKKGFRILKPAKQILMNFYNSFKAWRLITTANQIWRASGGHIGGQTFAAMCSAWYRNFKSLSASNAKSCLSFKRLSQTLAVVTVLIDTGIALYTVFSLIGSNLTPLELYQGLILAMMTLIYSLALTLIAEIPFVGALFALIIVISDLIGGWVEKVFNAIINAISHVTAQVYPSVEFVGDPSITIIDYDDNGIDVGDRIEFSARLNASLTSSDSFCLSASELYPYCTISYPAGSSSSVGYPSLTEWVFMAKDLGQQGMSDVRLWLPIPPARKYTYGPGWKANEYQIGGWVEPGIAMPNFFMNLEFKTEYEFWYKYEIFWFFVFYWYWEEYKGRSAGIMDLGTEKLYFDVLPNSFQDFVKWKSITAVDQDFDGLRNTEESASNPLLWDTDGDGLNDKFESDIGTNATLFDTDQDGLNDRLEQVYGTNATNSDTDGDGLSDYVEVSGWIAVFKYGGNVFAQIVTSDPLIPDSDGDGLTDNLEFSSRQNPKSKDSDGDGIMDQEREPLPLPDTLIDSDADGLNDSVEKTGWTITFANSSGTYSLKATSDPVLKDTDFDGLTDFKEYEILSNPRNPDTDSDGINDFNEVELGTNASSSDSDADGLSDGLEITFGCNPKKSDTDEDGLSDSTEILLNSDPLNNDTDLDGLDDLREVLLGSNILAPDSDNDLLLDGQEFRLGTNLLSNDTDGDGLIDGYEVMIGTNPLNSDTDNDGVSDFREIELGISPVSNDTDMDGLLDGTELLLGTMPWNNDTDRDGLNDLQDPDTYVPNVDQIIVVSDGNSTDDFINNLRSYTNVTVASVEELFVSYSNATNIVLIAGPSNATGTVGNLVSDLLRDYGVHLTNQTLGDNISVRYGVWNNNQTVVILSEPSFEDHFMVLSILKSKNVTLREDSVSIDYQVVNVATGSTLSFVVDEMDMVRATDTAVGVGLEQATNPSIQIKRYNSTTTPYNLTSETGLLSNEKATGKYLNIEVSKNVQNDTSDIISDGLVKIYYTAKDLDRTGDGDANDPADINENTLTLYYFNETSLNWSKLTTQQNWVKEIGLNTTDVEVYGKQYAGHIWANVSRFAYYALAGQTWGA